MTCTDDDEEGLIRSPKSPRVDETRQPDPKSLDFNTWKAKVGDLIRTEYHVMMHNDDELRNAISQAMFLEIASENLMKKRKRQLEIMDECRVEEGVAGKKLFEKNKESIQREFGPSYGLIANEWWSAFERASRPLDTPDIRRPPPVYMPLPPMHIPPPSFFHVPTPINPTTVSSTTSVTSAMSRAVITTAPQPPVALMSQHLLPPVVNKTLDVNYSYNRSALKHQFENEKKEMHTHESSNPKSLEIGDLSTSWRMPFHPIPVPPPTTVHPFIPSSLPPPVLHRNINEIVRRRINGNDKSPPPPPLQHSAGSPRSSPGLIGINLHGLFVGNRPRSMAERCETPRSHV